MGRKRKSSAYLGKTLIMTAVLFLFSFAWEEFSGSKNTKEQTTKAETEKTEAAASKAEPKSKAKKGLELPRPIDGHILISHSAYTVSFNTETLCPDYVAWHLTSDRIDGTVARTDNFQGDPDIDEAYRVEKYNYSGDGYDRGHMCPAADNKHDLTAMNECFYMTNMCPQNHSLNSGDWSELENQCRSWVREYPDNDVYIAAGPIFDDGAKKKIGRDKKMRIGVPTRFYKVVLIYGRVPRAIGFIYPNESTNKDMREYAVSVDEVEKITGIDFFYNLPDKTEDKIEAECSPASFNI